MNHVKIMSRSLWWLRQCLQRALASNFATTVEEDEKLLAFAPFKAIQVCVSRCVAVWCGVLRCVAVCRGVLQCGVVCCGVLRCVAVCCSVLWFVAVCCGVLRCAAVCCSVWHRLLSLKLIRCV